ncbi:MAG: O-antigen ligase family protein [Hyphomonas sp.]
MNVTTRIEMDDDRSLTWANVYSDERTPPIWEQAMVTLWFFLTYLPVPGGSAFLYLLVMAMMGILLLEKEKILPVVFQAWPLLLLPIFGIFSFMWSPHPSGAMRDGILLTLTAVIAVIIGCRLGMRYIFRCLMFAGWMATLYILPFGHFEYGGIIGSKNFLALQVTFMLLLSTATVLNKREPLLLRVAAIPFIPLGAYIVLSAHSATSLVFTVVGPFALLMAKLFWVEMADVRYVRGSVLVGAVILVLLVIMVILSMPTNNFEDQFLGLVGRERNLTGRTTIWMAGRVVQDQHPIFGTGLAGFWNPENGAAQSINHYDFKPYGTKLSFHNAYMEVRVHLGWIGFWLYVLIWSWCGFRILKTWLQSRYMEASFIVIATILVFISTFTESWAWAAFSTPVNVLYLGAVATLGGSRKQLVGKIPVVITSAPGKPARRASR